MDRLIASLIVLLIDIYIILTFVRLFLTESERYDATLGLIFRATDPVVRPLGTALRTRRFDFASLLVLLGMLCIKGLVLGSIPWAVQSFVNRLFQLYVLIILVISTYREYYVNPIASFGQRLVNPIRRVAAHFSRHVVTINLLSVLLLILLHTTVTLLLQGFIGGGSAPAVHAVFVYSLRLIIDLTGFFTIVIIIDALLSWVNPDPYNPIVQLIALIAAPIVEPIRRVIPPLGGMIDISPIIAIIALQVVNGIGHSILSML